MFVFKLTSRSCEKWVKVRAKCWSCARNAAVEYDPANKHIWSTRQRSAIELIERSQGRRELLEKSEQ